IAGVLDPVLAARRQGRLQCAFGDAEQWAQQPHTAPLPDGTHARETRRAALPRGTHGAGLDLVVEMMAEAEMQDAFGPAVFGQEAIAGSARRRLQPGLRLRIAPAENGVARDATRRKPATDPDRLRRGFWTESMIDGDRLDAGVAVIGPFVEQQSQRHAVGAAGNGHRNDRLRLERAEPRQQPDEVLGADALGALADRWDQPVHP